MDKLQDRLTHIQTRIRDACQRSDRDPQDVVLVGVSKTKPASMLKDAYALGLQLFGESYVQEWVDKREILSQNNYPSLSWHFIGRLQRNKCKFVVGHAALIHSVDSQRLLEEIARKVTSGHTQAILLQCNVSGEDSKSGFLDYDALLRATRQSIESSPQVSIEGLMTMPPYDQDPSKSRPYFRTLRQWRTQLRQDTGLALPHLSIGMSHDLEVAIEEGATFVRVGSALFGKRD